MKLAASPLEVLAQSSIDHYDDTEIRVAIDWPAL
jgi:hypothetical protein